MISADRRTPVAYDEDADYAEIRAMKRDDSYRFTYPFQYIVEKLAQEAYSDDDYVLGTTTIDVRCDWFDGDDARAPGYQITYTINDYDKIPVEFRLPEEEVRRDVELDVVADLLDAGVMPAAVSGD